MTDQEIRAKALELAVNFSPSITIQTAFMYAELFETYIKEGRN